MKQTRSNKEKLIKRIPHLKDEKSIAKFWDTHDVTDYWGDMEELDEPMMLSPSLEKRVRERHRKRLLTLRIEQGQISDARMIAAKKKMGYQTLLRMWIQAGIQHEYKAVRTSGRTV